MDVETFLNELLDLLQRDDPLERNTELKSMEEWDSMAIMACQSWFMMKFNIMIPYKQFAGMHTVEDLIKASDGNIA